eukprot:m.25086 g.25086  ORF g.25086 m.25086 type:complete len:509 (+) comp28733_c0_seq3:70-1596(+)
MLGIQILLLLTTAMLASFAGGQNLEAAKIQNNCKKDVSFVSKPYSDQKILCESALGLSTGFIGDSQLKASSNYDSGHDTRNVRLNTDESPGAAWCAKHSDRHQYFQVDFGKTTKVTGVATQGRPGKWPQWVTKYKILHSDDIWKTYRENSRDKEFLGNSDQYSVVRNDFLQPIVCRYIRINPVSWYGHISMRAEFFGCHNACESPLGMTTGSIPNSALATTRSHTKNHNQRFSRLNTVNFGPNSRAWAAFHLDQEQYLQIDIGYTTKVTAVGTQGRSACCDQWVKSYRIYYSIDGFAWKPYTANGIIKTFLANTDVKSVVRNSLSPSILARHVRINPSSFHGHISLRAEIYGCPKACDLPFGMTTGAIADHQIQASSDRDHNTRFARLNTATHGVASAWCSRVNDQSQWIQVNLGKHRIVTAVATQGRSDCCDQWVTSYEIEYGNDGSDWTTYMHPGSDKPMLFIGNSDKESVVKNALKGAISAQYVRIRPKSWHGHISLRFELFGCA